MESSKLERSSLSMAFYNAELMFVFLSVARFLSLIQTCWSMEMLVLVFILVFTLRWHIMICRNTNVSVHPYLCGFVQVSDQEQLSKIGHWFSFIGSAVKTPRLKREPSPDPFVPTPEQLQKILRFCDQHHNREVWFRNRLIIEIFSFTGVRVGELVKVNLEDAKDGFLYVRSEKGEKDRYVPLPQGLQEHIETYREKFRMQSDQRALLTTDKGRMPYEYIRSMIKKIGVRIGMPEIHAHSFRHFYGTYMYRTTNDLRLVQILLGHARIETTTIYEHLSTKEAAEKGIPAVERLFHGEDKIASWVRIPAGAVQNKWDHWDSNPDLRVSSGS